MVRVLQDGEYGTIHLLKEVTRHVNAMGAFVRCGHVNVYSNSTVFYF